MKELRTILTPLILILFASLSASCRPFDQIAPAQLEVTIQALQTEVSAQASRIAAHETYISYLATRAPPPPPTPSGFPRPTPFVVGSLLIEDGKCCVGAIAGQSIPIQVTFQAESPMAEVTSMRVRTGSTSFEESDFLDTEWEPFSSMMTFEYVAPLNWTGFHVTVQFRDALGNLSALYTNDISVEGMLAPPESPTP
jgi:hypothetical protein